MGDLLGVLELRLALTEFILKERELVHHCKEFVLLCLQLGIDEIELGILRFQ